MTPRSGNVLVFLDLMRNDPNLPHALLTISMVRRVVGYGALLRPRGLDATRPEADGQHRVSQT